MLTGFVLPGGSATEQLSQAVLAEQSGWDGVFVWEAAYGVDAWSLLAAMAARTERIRLGTLLTPLPWRREDKAAASAHITPWAQAGCTWWIENRWEMPDGTTDPMAVVSERLAAGPPVAASR